ncbi:MAG: hypothetical protein WAW92_03390 [Minisyncoccia bacterium]
MREEMSDGKLSIVADFFLRHLAEVSVHALREAFQDDVFTLCNENGGVTEDYDDGDFENLVRTSHPLDS